MFITYIKHFCYTHTNDTNIPFLSDRIYLILYVFSDNGFPFQVIIVDNYYSVYIIYIYFVWRVSCWYKLCSLILVLWFYFIRFFILIFNLSSVYCKIYYLYMPMIIWNSIEHNISPITRKLYKSFLKLL